MLCVFEIELHQQTILFINEVPQQSWKTSQIGFFLKQLCNPLLPSSSEPIEGRHLNFESNIPGTQVKRQGHKNYDARNYQGAHIHVQHM